MGDNWPTLVSSCVLEQEFFVSKDVFQMSLLKPFKTQGCAQEEGETGDLLSGRFLALDLLSGRFWRWMLLAHDLKAGVPNLAVNAEQGHRFLITSRFQHRFLVGN